MDVIIDETKMLRTVGRRGTTNDRSRADERICSVLGVDTWQPSYFTSHSFDAESRFSTATDNGMTNGSENGSCR